MTTTFGRKDIRTPYLKWALKARAGKKDMRAHLAYLMVNDGTAFCTDGRRLHAFTIGDVDDGFYDVAKNGGDLVLVKAECEAIMPNWKQVVPGRGDESTVPVPLDIDENWDEKAFGWYTRLRAAAKYEDNHGAFSVEKLHDAISIPGGVNWVTAGDGIGPIMFEQFECAGACPKKVFAVSVLMPIKLV